MSDPVRPASDDPLPKRYGFKPREFERVNTRATDLPTDPAPTSPQPSSAPPQPKDRPITVVELARQATPDGPLLFQPTSRPAASDLDEWLHLNAAREKALIAEKPPPKRPRVSRRVIDYLVLLWLGDGVLGATAWWAAKSGDMVTVVSALAGMLIYTLGITWIIWVVFDRY